MVPIGSELSLVGQLEPGALESDVMCSTNCLLLANRRQSGPDWETAKIGAKLTRDPCSVGWAPCSVSIASHPTWSGSLLYSHIAKVNQSLTVKPASQAGVIYSLGSQRSAKPDC